MKQNLMERLNIIGILSIILYSIIFAFIGISLPPTINFINGLDSGAFYGHFGSYYISILLFWIVTNEIKITKDSK
jgi:hypothetical protein